MKPLEFIKLKERNYLNITIFEKIVSSPFMLLVKFFLFVLVIPILFITVNLQIDLRGNLFLILFFLLFIFIFILLWNSFKKFELASPTRKKVFGYRISKLINILGNRIQNIKEIRNKVAFVLCDNRLRINYTASIIINMGGIILGTPIQIPKGVHPKTYFFSIKGKTEKFKNSKVNFDFSAREDDEDSVFGFGVRTYKIKYHKIMQEEEHIKVNESDIEDSEVLSFKDKLEKAIDGTMLKGEIEFRNGDFILRIFDNISRISYMRGKIVYKRYDTCSLLERNGITKDKMSIYGIKEIFKILGYH